MEYYKKREEDIRARWFNNHVATWHAFTPALTDNIQVHSAPRNIQCLTWRQPDSSNYYCRYIIDGRVLIVYGDAGDAVYGWSDKLTWEFLAGLDYDYFAGKCMASERGRGYKSWDGRRAEQRLKEHFAQDRSSNWTKACGIGGEPSLHHKDEWLAWLRENGTTAFGDDWYYMAEIGEVIDIRCQGHLIGIKMAFDQLKSQVKV